MLPMKCGESDSSPPGATLGTAWLCTLALVLSLNPASDPRTPVPNWQKVETAERTRTVIGSLADMSLRPEPARSITVIHILEFATDDPLREPHLLELRLCGNHSRLFAPAVHTNVSLVFDPTLHHRGWDCLNLKKSEPWNDRPDLLNTSPPGWR